jgi:acyl-CoA dehydrogenase
MEFELNDLEREIGDLAGSMLRDHSSPERLRELEDSGARIDLQLWSALREAGLTTVGIDEDHGGTGLGFAEACLVLEQLGATAAAVPLLCHLTGLHALQRAGAIAELREFAQSSRWIAVAARADRCNSVRIDGGRVAGEISVVPYATGAAAYVVPARHRTGWKLCLIRGTQAGIGVEDRLATDGSPAGKLTLGAEAQELGGPEVLDWLLQRQLVGSSAVQTGVVDEAIRLTTAYVSEREAFGVKIGTFQAVSQQMANAYIDAMTLQTLSRNAASVLARQDDGLVDALAAKLAAGDVGHRVLHICQQVHGGIGHDRGYPLWRYAVAAKQNEMAVMSSAEAVAALGRIVATDPDRVAL